MKNFFKLTGIISMILVIGIVTTGCKTLNNQSAERKLSVPQNVKIDVNVRLMTVTWDTVPNAQGYLIETTSVGCRSGNKIVNTKEGTAVMTSSGDSSLVGTDREDGVRVQATDNGAVQITGKNKFEITLMPEWNIPGDNTSGRNESVPMPSSLTAKVMALGGTVKGKEFSDSDYSAVVTYTIRK